MVTIEDKNFYKEELESMDYGRLNLPPDIVDDDETPMIPDLFDI